MNQKFWNWVKNEDTGESVMYLYSAIAETTWFQDDVTPEMFRSELKNHPGDVTVFLNSPGGDVFAASQIYTMLRNHKGNVTVKIDGIAASAASIVAMAGDQTLISPTGYLMCHNPMTVAMGNKSELEHAITMLDEIKEGIINAYVRKSHLSRAKIAKLMDEETWMNAEKALQLGFVDGILFDVGKGKKPSPSPEEEPDESEEEPEETPEENQNEEEPDKKKTAAAMLYSASKSRNSFLQKVAAHANSVPINQLDKRLELLKH